MKKSEQPAPRDRALDLKKLEALFVGGMLLPDIATALNCQVPTVRRRLGELGLLHRHERGPRGDDKRQKPILFTAKADTLPPVIIDRDPCTYCGVRGDIGCKHNRRLAA